MAHMHRHLSAFALAGLVAFAAPACAAQAYYGPPRSVGYEREVERRAYDRGFYDGQDEGRSDARHERHFSYDRHGDYRDADNGYHRGDGDREFYRRSYRSGFQAGYNEAYNRIAHNDRDWRR